MRIARVLVLCLLPSLAAAQPVEVLHRFEVPPFAPLGGLVDAGDGFLYGTTSEGGEGGLMYRIPVDGGPLTIVHRFTRGHVPTTSMIRGTGGVLYGTTQAGTGFEGGTVFRFDPATATLVTLHTLNGAPSGRVIQASDGLLYGTTVFELFQIDPITGRTRTLHTFPKGGPGPFYGDPIGGVTEAADGFLYGITDQLLYRADRAGTTLTVVHRYDASDSAWNPTGGLTLTSDGLLYGTTTHGGAAANGVAFRYDPATGSYANVWSFTNGVAAPSRLVEAADGSLYGTTRDGTVYRLRRPDPQTHVHSIVAVFDVPDTHGREPLADLALASDGWIYGAARTDGPSGGGTLFRVDSLERGPAGNPAQFSILHAFSNRGPGWRPAAEPVAGPGGVVYGMTNAGGANGVGDAYRLDTTTGIRTTVGAVPGVGFGGPPLFPEIGAINGRLVDGGDGSFYGTSLVSPGTTARILRVTPATNSVTIASEFPLHRGAAAFLAGLAGGPAGIYGLYDSPVGVRLFRFDPSVNGIVAEWTANPETSSVISAGLTVSGASVYVSSNHQGGNGQYPLRVQRVDTVSGASTLLASTLTVFNAVAPGIGPDGSVYYPGGDAFTGLRLLARTTAGAIQTVCTLRGFGQVTSINVTEDGGRVLVVAGTPAFDQALYVCPVVQSAPLPGAGQRIHPWAPADGRVSPLRHVSNQSYYGVTDERLSYASGDGLYALRSYDGGGTVFRVAFGSDRFDPDADGLTTTFETTFGLSEASALGDDGPSGDPDGDGVTNLEEQAAGTHPRGLVVRYLAEGAENAFFHTQIALANAGPTPATVLLRFETDSGAIVPRVVTVRPTARATVDAASVAGLGAGSFSTVIESDVPITVDRTMTWDATGYGSHRETAVAAPSTSWFFAEGTTTGDQSLFYLLQNPQASAVSATVRYLRALGLPPIEKTYVLPGHSRTTIPVDTEDPGLASTDVSAQVTSTAPIIAERAMYRNRPGQPFAAGSASAGVTAPALEWFLAEGATGTFFDLFILIANPNPAPASIEVQYLRSDGAIFLPFSYVVPANGRFTIWVDDVTEPGSANRPFANSAVSARVRGVNGLPIVVERTMWWPGPETTPDFWYESHNSPGATATALRWGIAGAEVGGADSAETFVLIANATASAGEVMVRVLFANGNTTGRVYAIAPQSRTNVSIAADFPEAAGERAVSVVVESIGTTPVPIAVESASYASPGGVTWARGTNALATPLP